MDKTLTPLRKSKLSFSVALGTIIILEKLSTKEKLLIIFNPVFSVSVTLGIIEPAIPSIIMTDIKPITQ